MAISVASFLVCLAVGELLVFHLVLGFKHLSTYDYILAQREALEARWQVPESPVGQSEKPGPGSSSPALCSKCAWPDNQVGPTAGAGGLPTHEHAADKHVVRVNICGAIWLIFKDRKRLEAQSRTEQAEASGPGQGPPRPQSSLESISQLPCSSAPVRDGDVHGASSVCLTEASQTIDVKSAPDDCIVQVERPV